MRVVFATGNKGKMREARSVSAMVTYLAEADITAAIIISVQRNLAIDSKICANLQKIRHLCKRKAPRAHFVESTGKCKITKYF